MMSIVGRIFTRVRVWLGFNDTSEDHMYEPYGWLLPAAAVPERAAEHELTGSLARILPDSRRD